MIDPSQPEAPKHEAKAKKQKIHLLTPEQLEEMGVEVDDREPHVWNLLSKVKRGRGDDAVLAADATPLNLRIVLTQDSRWAGKVRLNEFDGATYVQCPEDEHANPITGTTATQVVIWMERVYGMRFTEDRVGKSLNESARDCPFHPVRDALRSVKWDRKPRVKKLLSSYFCSEDTELNATLSKAWMVSAVARVMRPGCKVDTTLILVGTQGAQKSTGIKTLAIQPDWFSDTLLDLGSKDLYEAIHGVWLYELAELDSFRKAEWPKIKAILSSPRDRYRRPYCPAAEPRDRQCIFVGTTNDDEFLGDPTGSRRFWPVRVGERVDIAALKRDRLQLWAEAVAMFDAGDEWWLSKEDAESLAAASDEFRSRHPWHDLISSWVITQADGFTIAEVLNGAVKKESGQWHGGDAKIAGGVLRDLGFESKRERVNGKQVRTWSRV